MPRTTVHAFDIDSEARARCAALAQLNGVAERVRIDGLCEPSTLNAFPEHGVALFSDCEGYERFLLDPDVAPQLRNWPILVELHEFEDRSLFETLRARLGTSHEIEIIEGRDRSADQPPELDFMTPSQRVAVLSERRPGRMRWAHMRPR
jgi:hypothetical protein